MDYFDEIEADRILKNLEIHFFWFLREKKRIKIEKTIKKIIPKVKTTYKTFCDRWDIKSTIHSANSGFIESPWWFVIIFSFDLEKNI